MTKHDVLEMILNEEMDGGVRNTLVHLMFDKAATVSKGNSNGIPKLKNCPDKLECDDVFRRMKMVAGDTGVGVAKILGVTPQAFNNQTKRQALSGNSLIDFHFKTGISLDWLIGSWDGSSTDYFDTIVPNKKKSGDDSDQKYLSLVEIYNQTSGVTELKWCLNKRHICLDSDDIPVSEYFNALYSLIRRYKNEAGTPALVKRGVKHHFQVRRVIAYVVGEPKLIRNMDGQAKKLTKQYLSGQYERPGKTEFREYSSMDKCLIVLASLAEQCALEMVCPEYSTIAWDYLIGAGSMSPEKWIVSKFKSSESRQQQEEPTTDGVMVGSESPEVSSLYMEQPKSGGRRKDTAEVLRHGREESVGHYAT
ncbi:MAG: hypothetical protein JZU65_03890 [Chlorobium sp.]|nr:hypothetical protein [Chlorobium sp.]